MLGIGGIDKSALVTTAMHHVAEQFDAVIWRSLRESPTCETLVDGALQTLVPQACCANNSMFNGKTFRTFRNQLTHRLDKVPIRRHPNLYCSLFLEQGSADITAVEAKQ